MKTLWQELLNHFLCNYLCIYYCTTTNIDWTWLPELLIYLILCWNILSRHLRALIIGYESIHCIPGSEISEIGELVSRYSMDSGLIVINAGINDLLKGFSVQNCLYSYDVLRKKIKKNVHPSAHVAFTSISYIADNKFDAVDLSNEINPLVDALNTALDIYCTTNEYTYLIELRSILFRDGSSPIDRCNLCFDGLHYSTVEHSNLLC